MILKYRMMKRVIIVHGWGGSPDEGWFPWLKKELEKRKFRVNISRMPSPNHPKIETWVSHLAKVVKNPDKDTYFVGHSIGCQTVLRYLQTIDKQVGGVILVGGWFLLRPEATETEEDKQIAKPWVETPIYLNKIRNNAKTIIAIFSDNDPWVPYKENSKRIKEKLNAKIILEKNKGHFSGSDNIKELPIVLKELLRILK